MIRSFPPHPNPLPPGEGRPFIPPAELGGILEYFDKKMTNEDVPPEIDL